MDFKLRTNLMEMEKCVFISFKKSYAIDVFSSIVDRK